MKYDSPPNHFAVAIRAESSRHRMSKLKVMLEQHFPNVDELRKSVDEAVAVNHAWDWGDHRDIPGPSRIALNLVSLALMTYAERDGGRGEYRCDIAIAMSCVGDYLQRLDSSAIASAIAHANRRGAGFEFKLVITFTLVQPAQFEIPTSLLKACTELDMPILIQAEEKIANEDTL